MEVMRSSGASVLTIATFGKGALMSSIEHAAKICNLVKKTVSTRSGSVALVLLYYLQAGEQAGRYLGTYAAAQSCWSGRQKGRPIVWGKYGVRARHNVTSRRGSYLGSSARLETTPRCPFRAEEK